MPSLEEVRTQAKRLDVKGIKAPLWLGSISLAIIAIISAIIFIGVLRTVPEVKKIIDATLLAENNPTERGHLYIEKRGYENIYVPIDREGFRMMSDALNNKDNKTIELMKETGRLIFIENGAEVIILEKDANYPAIKVMIADGRYTGKTVWISWAWLIE